MAIELKPEDQEFVSKLVLSGKYPTEQDVIADALSYLHENEILSTYSREELNSLIEEGERAFENGDYEEIDDDFFERIKSEGRKILAERLANRREVA